MVNTIGGAFLKLNGIRVPFIVHVPSIVGVTTL